MGTSGYDRLSARTMLLVARSGNPRPVTTIASGSSHCRYEKTASFSTTRMNSGGFAAVTYKIGCTGISVAPFRRRVSTMSPSSSAIVMSPARRPFGDGMTPRLSRGTPSNRVKLAMALTTLRWLPKRTTSW